MNNINILRRLKNTFVYGRPIKEKSNCNVNIITDTIKQALT